MTASVVKPEAEDNLRESLKQSINKIDPAVKKTIDKAQPVETDNVSASDMNTLAYKTMPSWIYLSVTVAIYVSEIALAILIDDIGNVFNFIVTFAGSGLCFWIPSLLFQRGYTLYASEEYKAQNKCIYIASWINFFMGFFFFGLFLYANIEAIL